MGFNQVRVTEFAASIVLLRLRGSLLQRLLVETISHAEETGKNSASGQFTIEELIYAIEDDSRDL